LLNIRIWNKKT